MTVEEVKNILDTKISAYEELVGDADVSNGIQFLAEDKYKVALATYKEIRELLK